MRFSLLEAHNWAPLKDGTITNSHQGDGLFQCILSQPAGSPDLRGLAVLCVAPTEQSSSVWGWGSGDRLTGEPPFHTLSQNLLTLSGTPLEVSLDFLHAILRLTTLNLSALPCSSRHQQDCTDKGQSSEEGKSPRSWQQTRVTNPHRGAKVNGQNNRRVNEH